MMPPAAGGPGGFRPGTFLGMLIVAGLVGLFIVFGPGWMRDRDSPASVRITTERPIGEAGDPRPGGSARSDPETRLPVEEALAKGMTRDPAGELERARRARDEARIRYEAARAAVAEAQALMLNSERDVEELERFIEELEARGEDPVDHAEEGMERFMPAFEAYEVALDRLEQAEEEEAIARLQFLGAERRLEAAQRRPGTSP